METGANNSAKAQLKDYIQLTKPSLTIMVVFSSVICYLLAPKVVQYDGLMIVLLFIGGFLVAGSANAINQTVEKETDRMMKRTSTRPVASGRLSETQGWAFAVITGVAGVAILSYFFNFLSGALAAFSLFLYAFVYTPLKKVNAIAVLVGAIPGALPCLIGWAAGNDSVMGFESNVNAWGGWLLFLIQFLWQFPHFWAIAWIAHKDYSGAGFRLLPAEKGPTKFTAIQTVMYAVLLIPVCVLPYFIGMTEYQSTKGLVCLVIVMLANFFLIAQCVRLYKEMNAKAARRVMFSSYIYLPIVLLALLASKN
ncbi:heme o synthase [Flavisolibacter nicotianae]|uniref:heme o synthase n=1 Tax=Flavisolibacter nicotianae TaxID=2364882 RepID=UPI001F097226|nr:heme o synthase [Flavisolibacter nicotianae]